MNTAYPLQWYILDGKRCPVVSVPAVKIDHECRATSVNGMCCTRPFRHGGRHAAGGSIDRDSGTFRVYEVWS